MRKESLVNRVADKIIAKLSFFSSQQIILIVTINVLVMSIPAVHLVSFLFNQEYTFFLFFLSIILPMLLTPLVIFVLIRITRHLSYYREHLKEEIEKNKQKDVILFEQARFVFMGEMMANISHQWKQPLNTIGLAVVSSRLSDKEEDRENNFNIIEDNVRHLAETVDDFMSFFDKKTHIENKNLVDIIKEIKSIVEAVLVNNGVKLTIVYNELGQNLELASSVSQVILNLLNNANEAFDASQFNKEVELSFETKENTFEITCCDNGKGMAEDLKDKIFDPYFTTKDKTQGTGIGLYMSKLIIQKVFHGEIYVHLNSKTCFYISLPYSEKCIYTKDVN
jgi:signal transduction histidine kinase